MYKLLKLTATPSNLLLKTLSNAGPKHVSTQTQLFTSNKSPLIVNVRKSDDILEIQNDKKTLNFPFVWLRDNCQCDKCFHNASKSRIHNWKYFDINPQPRDVVCENNENISIKWSDNHSSIYNIDWLDDRSFIEDDRKRRTETVYKLKRIEWSKDNFFSICRRHDYHNILSTDNGLKDWLESLSIYGVNLITNAGKDEDTIRKLAGRVDFIKRTHYGEEFIVKHKPDTTNTAYLSGNLQLHTDLPYYEYKPGVNLLHCVTQTAGEGGDNLLCDGLYVANQFKQHYKLYYELLSQISIDWEDFGVEDGNRFHSLYRCPVICEDLNGDVTRVNISTPQRGSHMNVPIEVVKPWYEAFKAFIDTLYEQSAEYKVTEGEILCFDNKRLLHGRNEYKDENENTRYIIGAYLDWDIIDSRLRVLRQK